MQTNPQISSPVRPIGAAPPVGISDWRLLTAASVWAAALLVLGIRRVAVVMHLNAPQPFRLGDRT